MIQGETKDLVDDMYTEAARLETFKTWPFGENVKCSASKMAEAGFFHCPTEKETDLVQCFVCFKELDGWEENDDPWDEHFSHSKNCVFAKLHKPQNMLKIQEVFEIECERKINKIKRNTNKILKEFKSKIIQVEDIISSVYDELK